MSFMPTPPQPQDPMQMLARMLSGGPGLMQPGGRDVYRTLLQGMGGPMFGGAGGMGMGMLGGPLGIFLARLMQKHKSNKNQKSMDAQQAYTTGEY